MTILVTHNKATGMVETTSRAAMLSTTISGAQFQTIFMTGGTRRRAPRRSLHFASVLDCFTESFSSMSLSTRPTCLARCRNHPTDGRTRRAIQHAGYQFLTIAKLLILGVLGARGRFSNGGFCTAGCNFYLEEKEKADGTIASGAASTAC